MKEIFFFLKKRAYNYEGKPWEVDNFEELEHKIILNSIFFF